MNRTRFVTMAALAATLMLVLPAVGAISPGAKRWTSYDHVCGGDVDIQCCKTPSSNPADGFCDPTTECIVWAGGECVNRPLPSRPPDGQDGDCAGEVDHQCNVCISWNPTTGQCYYYAECASYVHGRCVLYRP